MTAEVNLDIHADELAQIVESVFATMMELEATPLDAPWCIADDRVTAAVQLNGDWNGAVLVECGHQLACRLAGRFVGMDPPEEVDEIVRDVMGELANMIGGNLKCVLTQGLQLSIPSVVSGHEYTLQMCRADARHRLTFQCPEGRFWITVLVLHH
jgi:chemotaxis protein CheX